MNTAVKPIQRMPPGHYLVQGLQTLNAGSTVTIDFSNLSKVISDARKLGKTPFVHAISFVIGHTGTFDVSAHNAMVSDIQRGCFYDVNFQQPTLTQNMFSRNPSLAFIRQVGRLVNAPAVALDRNLQLKRRLYNRQDTTNTIAATGSVIPSPDVDKRPDLLAGWGDDENFQLVASTAATNFDFHDVFSLPLCKAVGGWFNDKIPLMMIADSKNPWKVTIGEITAGGNNIRTDMFRTTAHSVQVGVYVYLSFLDSNSDITVGTLWNSISLAFSNNTPLPAHYTKFFGITPVYTSSQKDGPLNIPTPYVPFNFQSILNQNEIRVFYCNEQVFPLSSDSSFARIWESWQLGASVGEHPCLNYNEQGTYTFFKSGGSTIAVGEIATWYSNTALGLMTGFPFLPLIANNFMVKGFVPNHMDKPGCDANYRVSIDGGAPLPTTNLLMVYVGEYPADRKRAMSYALFGTPDGAIDESLWNPDLSNSISAQADNAKDIVPWTLKR